MTFQVKRPSSVIPNGVRNLAFKIAPPAACNDREGGVFRGQDKPKKLFYRISNCRDIIAN